MAADAEPAELGEDDQVYRWRRSRFRRLGCDRREAALLALEEVDYREAERLIEKGCPPGLLARILL